ncbi:MAG: tRNA (N(6)-L-threonylcarbamoyladenosine(37)-C(2))-methylthiotransferase [archaeon]
MKVFVKTFGCVCNHRDSENICGILLENDFEVVDSVDESDIVVVNSCGVKTVTQNRVVSFINSLPEDKKVFVGGCLPRMVDLKKICPGVDAVFDPNTILSLPDILRESKDVSSDEKEGRLNIPIKRMKKSVANIPICQGCLGECTYCSVRFARGELKSYPKDEILREVRDAVSEGCTRINLTAQDTGCWGLDIGDSLPNLLREVLAVKGDFIVRVGMMNPDFAKKYLKDLVEIFKSEKVLRFVHVPVQSGSDKVLGDMGRKYSVDDFKGVVAAFRKGIPKICISTDVIVGFPSETEVDFRETVELIKETRPDIVNISRFGARLGTPAAELEQLSDREVKGRSVLLDRVVKRSFQSPRN